MDVAPAKLAGPPAGAFAEISTGTLVPVPLHAALTDFDALELSHSTSTSQAITSDTLRAGRH